MSKRYLIIFIVVIVIIGVFVYKNYSKSGYKTREECETITSKTCVRSFGDYVLPSDPKLRKQAKDCIKNVPNGWAPADEFPKCEWPLE